MEGIFHIREASVQAADGKRVRTVYNFRLFILTHASNSNACYTAFFQPGNLAQALIGFGFKSLDANPRDVSFANIRVKVKHTGFKKRVLTVGTASARQTLFYWDKVKKKVSVAEYMKQRTFIFMIHFDAINVIGQQSMALTFDTRMTSLS